MRNPASGLPSGAVYRGFGGYSCANNDTANIMKISDNIAAGRNPALRDEEYLIVLESFRIEF
jgi:hypothetical protein